MFNLLKNLRKLFVERRGAVAVEVAFLMPVLASIAFLSYDYAAVDKQRSRALYAYDSVGEALSGETDPISCTYLGNLAKLAYDSYQKGNWGKVDETEAWTFDDRGAEDFRLQIRGVIVVNTASGPRGRVLWAFHRTPEGIAQIANRKPGSLINIPREYRLVGEFYIMLNTENHIKAPMNFFGFYTNAKPIKEEFFYSPRFQAMIPVKGPQVRNRCEYI